MFLDHIKRRTLAGGKWYITLAPPNYSTSKNALFFKFFKLN